MDDRYTLEQVAAEFWGLVGEAPTYPCDLEAYLLWALPLEIRRIPGLRINDVHAWAQRIGISYRFVGRDRRLRGCLIAYRESGLILLDDSDPEAERRFTLAHELAHFLIDYRAPRQRALQVLGEAIRPVLDGLRPPTLAERVHAVLADVPLGVHGHLLERPDDGLPSNIVLTIENRADHLALELLAPAAVLRERLAYPAAPAYFRDRVAYVTTILSTEHGLPTAIAAAYARALLRDAGGPSVRDWLLGTGE